MQNNRANVRKICNNIWLIARQGRFTRSKRTMKELQPTNLPSALTLSPDIFALGKILFQLGGTDQLLLREVEGAFVPFNQSWARDRCLNDESFTPLPQAFNVDRLKQQYLARPWETPAAGFAIWCIMDRAVNDHIQLYPDDLAVEGALMLTPAGTTVWISGATQAGKTTLVVALALSLGWRIITENHVFVDHMAPVPVVGPLSLRPLAPQLIEEATGIRVAPILAGRWLIRADLFHFHALPPGALVAVHLSLTNPGNSTPLQIYDIPWTRYLRMVLPISNAPKIHNGLDRLSAIFQDHRCVIMKDGNLASRLDAMSRL